MTSCANVERESEFQRPSARRRKLILEFKGTHDKNSHSLRIMHARSSAPGVDGIKSYMSDNSDSDNSAKFQAFEFIRSKIPYSPVLQELHRKGNAECLLAGSKRHIGFQLQL